MSLHELTRSESLPILELDVLLERIAYDNEIAHELLNIFLSESKEVMDQLTATMVSNNPAEQVAQAAHKLKGMCHDVGAQHLGSLAYRLESQAKEKALEKSSETCTQLEAGYVSLCKAIEEWLLVNNLSS